MSLQKYMESHGFVTDDDDEGYDEEEEQLCMTMLGKHQGFPIGAALIIEVLVEGKWWAKVLVNPERDRSQLMKHAHEIIDGMINSVIHRKDD